MSEENGTSILSKRFVDDCKEQFQRIKYHILERADLCEKDAHKVVETLLFRLLFLRFLEEKGWLTFQGNSHYLSSLCDSGGIHSKSVYSSRFRPLFSKGLSVEGNQESDVYGSVPYLNLNLFRETSLDLLHWDISDDHIQSLIGKKGLFYSYQFDIDEFGPNEAINPEIIGTLFEEFVTDRQEKGVFYTPKPVVRYMCAEGIKLILEEQTDLLPEQVMDLIDQDTLGTITIEQAQLLRKELRSIKTIDPACGSGAYLIGLLQELVRIDCTLSSYLGNNNLSKFHLKRQLISQSLFGMDIDSAAVHRTRCRLWLSLATDSSLPFTVLDEEFNLESGDSLLGLGPKCVQGVLAEDGGFDLVLANPPYVHHRHIDSNFKKKLLQQYGHLECSPVDKTSDLYCYFFLRANELLRPNGIQIFICSNSWLDAQFGTSLQRYLLQKTHIISLIDSRKKKQFGNAEVNTILSIIRKSKPADTNFILFESKFSEAIQSPNCRTSRTISQLQLIQSGLDQQGLYAGQRLSLFHRAPEIYLTMRDRIQPISRELQQHARISRGSSTGANAFFYLSKKEIANHGIEEEF
ncbi:MAG: N-6 DNA methylase, partial [Candidatus Poseidoniaceae archaeon]|nr:N-6 DNA methylase [Candidatus Poseidoniaceae archaeon]